LPPSVIARAGLRGGERDLLHDEIAAHADVFTGDRTAPRGAKNLERFGVQDLDADLFENAHRAVVNGGDPFLGERFGRPIGVDRRVPWHLLDGPRAAPLGIARAPAAPFSACLDLGHSCHSLLD